MAEYIEREAAISTACKGCNKEFPNEPCEPAECYIQQGLFAIPAADVVEVVRCKDCRYKVVTKDGEYNPHDIVCEYHMSDGFDETDYCSYGAKNWEKPLLYAYMEEIIDATD